MPNQPLIELPDREEEVDCSWNSVKASATDFIWKFKLFLKNLPGELADAADDYICTKAESIKEFFISRINRTRNRVKQFFVHQVIRTIDFTIKIVFFRVFKLKLDRIRRNFEKLNDENDLEQARREIGKRMIGLHQPAGDFANSDSPFHG